MILYVSFFTLFVVALKGDSTRSDRWRSVKKANHKIDLEHDFQGEIFFFFSVSSHSADRKEEECEIWSYANRESIILLGDR